MLRQSEEASAADLETIEKSLQRAHELVRETGARSRSGYLEEEWGRFACLLDDRERGNARLRDAQRIYAQLGATGHAERLAKESAGLPS